MANLLIGITALLVITVSGYLLIRARKKRLRKKQQKHSYWSIGYQITNSPKELHPETAHVYSMDKMPSGTAGIADPFLLENGGKIYLFYELILKSEPAAKIAVSVYDNENHSWDFHSIVLDEPFHLSYPHVFMHDSDIYMIPESKEAQSVRLYRSIDFPSKWRLERTLIQNKKYVDSSIFYWKDHLFLFTTRKRKLYLFYSKSLEGTWSLHPKSPIKCWNYARCAGRIFEHNGKLFRFAQEQAKGYGMGVRLYEILELSTESYEESAVDHDLFLQPFGDDWAQYGMHHVDSLRLSDNSYLSVFDGKGIIRNL